MRLRTQLKAFFPETWHCITGHTNMSVHKLIPGILVLAQLCTQAVAQGVVYTWVDIDGVTHFSDNPPVSDAVVDSRVESLAMPEGFPDPPDPDQDYYSIANQWKRMNVERVENEKLALLRMQARTERIRVENEAGKVEAVTAAALPVIVGGGHFNHPQRPLFRIGHGIPGRHQFGNHEVHSGFSHRLRGLQESPKPQRRQQHLGNTQGVSAHLKGNTSLLSTSHRGFSLHVR